MAATAAVCAAGVAVSAYVAGWLEGPRLTSFGLRGSDGGDRVTQWVDTRAAVVLTRPWWRPMSLTATLVPGPDRPVANPVTVGVLGVPGDLTQVDVSAAVHLEVLLPRLTTAGALNTVTITPAAGSMVGIRDVRATLTAHWAVWWTVVFAGAVGLWLTRVWTAVGEPRAARLTTGATPRFFQLQLVGLGLGLMILRKPDAILLPQLWAEDGVIFLQDAFVFGIDALARPYAGYHHLFPRLVAALARELPAFIIPLAFALASIVPVVIVAFLLASRRLPFSRRERVGLMLIIALPPIPGEVLLNVTNAQWTFAHVLMLLLLTSRGPTTWKGAAAEWALTSLTGLTGPFSLMFAPLYVIRAFVKRSAHAAVAASIVVATAVIQGATLVTSRRLALGEPVPGDVLLANLGRRLTAALHLTISEEVGFVLATAVAGVAVLVLVYCLLDNTWDVAACVGASLMALGMMIFGLRDAPFALLFGNDRYFSLPIGLLLWGGVLGLKTHPRLVAPAMACSFWLSAPMFLVGPLPDLQWREASRCLETTAACSVPINPAGWTIHVPAWPGR